MSLDLVTGHPESSGNTIILSIINRFSKMAHFVALPKLPSGKETAELVVQDAIWIHGLLVDIVSDQGPKITSIV